VCVCVYILNNKIINIIYLYVFYVNIKVCVSHCIKTNDLQIYLYSVNIYIYLS
jgi:hypothetical protein